MTDQQKHEYLVSWYWDFEFNREYGFNIYSHNRFDGNKYKLNRAYEVMKANEPSFEPIITARLDNELEMDAMRLFVKKNILQK